MNRILICAVVRGLVFFTGTIATLRSATPFKPNLGPDLPSITVVCGEVTLLLRQSSQWTPGRLDFRGQAMTTERSAYGTVFSFPDCGFIGTAHLENQPEQLLSLAFQVDDRPVEPPAARLEAKSFGFERRSRIRDFNLLCLIELRDNRVFETTTVRAAKETPLKLLYHFMHAWAPTVSAFCAGNDSNPTGRMSGVLRDGDETARKFFINRRVDWMAVREPTSGQFAVSRLLAAPDLGGHVAMIWNVPGSYRKFYLKCFENGTVPAGFEGTWKMVTAFGSAAEERWEDAAAALAGGLREAP